MRKFVLMAAMVLISASAQAGFSRSLTMASNDEPAVAEAPKLVERPAAIKPTADGFRIRLTIGSVPEQEPDRREAEIYLAMCEAVHSGIPQSR